MCSLLLFSGMGQTYAQQVPTACGCVRLCDVKESLSGAKRVSLQEPSSDADPFLDVGQVYCEAGLQSACCKEPLRPPVVSSVSSTAETYVEMLPQQLDLNDPQLVRRKKKLLTRQAAGHGGSTILKDFADETEEQTGIPEYIIKVYDEGEADNLHELWESNDPLTRFTPRYTGDVWIAEDGRRVDMKHGEGSKGLATYMRLSNLLQGYPRGPHVMDCKIGYRSFQEAEAAKSKPRPDLYKKMIDLDPTAPTEEERAAEACTKYRWMSLNDSLTNMPKHAFRIDGIAHSGGSGAVSKKELKAATTISQFADNILLYFLPPTHPKLHEDDCLDQRRQVAKQILADLKALSATVRKSPFALRHEFVGCSLLFIADLVSGMGSAHIIDFAKVTPVPKDITIDHRSPWVMNNHEDGLFVGVETAIATWEEVLSRL